MCYSVKYLKDKLHKYAKHHDIDDSQIPNLFDQHYTSGFSHPDLAVIVDADPKKFSLFNWGLIPFWVKDAQTATKLSNQTLNSRSETMFDKPSFRNSALKKRCLIVIDGFYEYHHHDSKQLIPYFIYQKNDEPLILAGLWEHWDLKNENIKRNTVSIVTTKANKKMAAIHNNPKVLQRTGPRMPLIFNEDLASEWLKHDENPKIEKERIAELCHPYPDDLLKYHSVGQLQGKNGIGNDPKASEEIIYELENLP